MSSPFLSSVLESLVSRTVSGLASRAGLSAGVLSKGLQTTWADFDRLLFETDSAMLKAESQEQISNLTAILKAYPNLKLKIRGNTDNTGDAPHSLKLSQERADGVAKSLVGLGAPADRLEDQGYGQEHAIAPNTTEECRALNRRIAISVRAKQV